MRTLMKGDKVTSANLHLLTFPKLASPKLDGIRASVDEEGFLRSYNDKVIRNTHTQALFGGGRLNTGWRLRGLDGELIVGEATSPTCFNTTTRGVMSIEGKPDVTFHVFDRWNVEGEFRNSSFQVRLAALREFTKVSHIKVIPHITIKTLDELLRYEEVCLTKGYEGVMLRDPAGPYKHGRSTFKEGWLLKLKRFEDSEATVLGAVELRHNHNAKDESGKRTNHSAGKTAGGVLGAFQVRDVNTGVEFEVGTGFTQEERVAFWLNRDQLVGKLITYKFCPIGIKEKPRHPVFKGFREDM